MKPFRLMQAPTHCSRGFTVIEALNAGALSLVLITIGMYAIARYEHQAKTTEAVRSLKAIAVAAASYYDASDSVGQKRHFPLSARQPVPADPKLVSGKRYRSDISDWAQSPWRELGFHLEEPQYYAYSFDSNGTGEGATATITARGDLNGDGRYSEYVIRVAATPAFKAHIEQLERKSPDE